MTTYEINHLAIQVLTKEIGIVNTLRFIRQFTNGYGDYTKDRQRLYKDVALKDIVSEIKAAREKS